MYSKFWYFKYVFSHDRSSMSRYMCLLNCLLQKSQAILPQIHMIRSEVILEALEMLCLVNI